MTEIKREERIDEVMRRTMFNYEFIKARHQEHGPYEVTQLVNSFLGALVHPWEAMSRDIDIDLDNTTLNQARLKGWPVFQKKKNTDEHPKSYAEMLKWTRHSFAHGNIEFFSQDGQIVEIAFWNERSAGRRTWGTQVKIERLEDFLCFFQDFAEGRIPRSRDERLAQSA